jgi:hypothetical protein
LEYYSMMYLGFIENLVYSTTYSTRGSLVPVTPHQLEDENGGNSLTHHPTLFPPPQSVPPFYFLTAVLSSQIVYQFFKWAWACYFFNNILIRGYRPLIGTKNRSFSCTAFHSVPFVTRYLTKLSIPYIYYYKHLACLQ